VVDNCSLIKFFDHYYFDRYTDNVVYPKLEAFIISKIKSGEIIVIDKVISELNGHSEFKKQIKPFVKNTLPLFGSVQALIKKYYLVDNERYYSNDPTQIEREMTRYETKTADLFLIAYCKQLKDNGEYVLLITEETPSNNNYKKLVEKIPTICKSEGIAGNHLPHSLFGVYKDELKFDLRVIQVTANQTTFAS
jgi:hypothetical protein